MSLTETAKLAGNQEIAPLSALRFLFATNIPFPEGRANTRRIRTIARELVRQGHQVSILLPFARKHQAKSQIIEGIQVEWCIAPQTDNVFLKTNQRVKLSVQFLSRCRWLKRLWQKSKRKEYDWLYLYQPGFDGLIAAIIARYFGRKVCSEYVDLLSSEGYQGLLLRLIYKLQLIADNKVPALSHQMLTISSLLEKVYHQRSLRSSMLNFPILVDTVRFGTGDQYRFRQKLNIRKRFVITFTGSFTRPQGLRVLIEAIANVVRQYPDVMLLIAGGSLVDDADDADLLINKYDLKANALYLGMLDEVDIIDLQAGSDILVMPKLDDPVNHAGLSTKLSEYLASGKAVIASDVGDVGKYLIHEKHALLVPPGDNDALERAILRLLVNPELRMLLGSNGSKAAIHYFDIRVNVMRLVEALHKHS